jgi:3-methyladenine DNA glycosylase AlkC
MAETFSLKDHLFNKGKVQKIAAEIAAVYPAFAEKVFVQEVVGKFPELELKARITWIAACLKKYLPVEYKKAVQVLMRALPKPNNPELSDDDFGDFIYAPYGEFIAKYGCTKEYLNISLKALYEITQRFSMEDAIRYFINAFPKETLSVLHAWCADDHYHVRRLCSEGTRPKLPWSQKIVLHVKDPLPHLDVLFSDTTRYVTRSVANHMNDIAKVHPQLALTTLKRWKKSKKQNKEEMDYIVRHALRGLVKEGNPEALALLGFAHDVDIAITNFTVPKTVSMNTALQFSCVVQSSENTNALVDYVLYFQNKAGKMESKKVFKLTKVQLTEGKAIALTKRHMLRAQMTTRTLYRGAHKLIIQVNGKALAEAHFMLV